jgi:hypothetical protein
MLKQYQLPDSVSVIDAKNRIVEIEVSNLSQELEERLIVLGERLSEELGIPRDFAVERLQDTLEELTTMTLFRGTRDVSDTGVEMSRCCRD